MAVHPIAFRVGPWEIHTWGVLFALGFGIAIWAAERNARRLRLPEWVYVESSLYVAIGAILGARLLYVALEWQLYAGRGWAILNTREGGLSLYGGLAGGVLAGWLFGRFRRLPFATLLDGAAPSLALGTAITRVGCLLEGCCWGIPTGGSWGVLTRFAPGLRHPAQLYESVLDLILFVLLWRAVPRLKAIRGQLFLLYLGGYSFLRFLVELFRDVPHVRGWITVTQPAALVTAGVCFAVFWYRAKRGERRDDATRESDCGGSGRADGPGDMPGDPGGS